MRVLTRPGAVALILTACTLLGGCGTLQGGVDALSNDRPIAPYESPNLASATAVRAELGPLLTRLVKDGMPVCTPQAQAAKGVDPCTFPETIPTETQSKIAAIYLDRSIFVIDAYCDSYLGSLDRMGANSRFSRSQINAVFNYIGVLKAMAGDSAESIGYLNAAAGMFNTSADNLETLVLISPTPNKLGPLVEQAMTESRRQLSTVRQAEATEKWSTTTRWVQQYAALCTPKGIRRLLDEAIESQTGDGATPTKTLEAAKRLGPGIAVALAAMTDSKDSAAWAESLSNPDALGALAWRIRDNDTLTEAAFPARRAYLRSLLGEAVDDAVTQALSDPAKAAQLKALMAGGNKPALDQLVSTVEAAEAEANSSAELILAEQQRDRAKAAAQKAEEARLAALTSAEQAESARIAAVGQATAAETAKQQAETDKKAAEEALEKLRKELEDYKAAHPDS